MLRQTLNKSDFVGHMASPRWSESQLFKAGSEVHHACGAGDVWQAALVQGLEEASHLKLEPISKSGLCGDGDIHLRRDGLVTSS